MARWGKYLCWDVTVICPLADSYFSGAAGEAGLAAELAVTSESLGGFSSSARQLISHIGRRISQNNGDESDSWYLFQRISVLFQRFNAVLLHDSLPVPD